MLPRKSATPPEVLNFKQPPPGSFPAANLLLLVSYGEPFHHYLSLVFFVRLRPPSSHLFCTKVAAEKVPTGSLFPCSFLVHRRPPKVVNQPPFFLPVSISSSTLFLAMYRAVRTCLGVLFSLPRGCQAMPSLPGCSRVFRRG